MTAMIDAERIARIAGAPEVRGATAVTSVDDREVRHRSVDVGPDADGRHVRLHVASLGEGAVSRPPVVLLHGFPEHWWSWRFQMPALADAGFAVYAPDQRGYADSDKPRGVSAYHVDRLVEDVAGLVRSLGVERVHLVGHDWGGVVAWHVAARRPELVERLVVMNAPHPNLFARELRTLEQLRKSWYIFAFQLPWFPESRLVRRSTLERTFRGWSRRREHFGDAVIDRYVDAVATPGAPTAMVHWYRALLRRPVLHIPRIEAETLLVWGMDDRALGPRLTEGLEAHVPRLRIARIAEASHWVQQDAPEKVNELLLAFLGTR
jgi:pimeloyl-ACP methyl ester carboxylesterase